MRKRLLPSFQLLLFMQIKVPLNPLCCSYYLNSFFPISIHDLTVKIFVLKEYYRFVYNLCLSVQK